MGIDLTRRANEYAHALAYGDDEAIEIAAENLRQEQERVKREKIEHPATAEWEGR